MDLVLVSLVVTPVAALYVLAVIYAIRQIVRAESLNVIERLIWALVIVAFPFTGALVWFVTGPHPFGLRIETSGQH